MTKASEREAKRAERVRRTKDRYDMKLALAKAWEGKDPEYVRQKKDQAAKLQQNLITKNVIFHVDMDL